MGIFSHIPRPFRKESVDNYQGVLVPLAQAKRHQTVEAEYARRFSSEGVGNSISPPGEKKDGEGKLVVDDEEGNAPARARVWDGSYTVEMLRDEVNADIAASGHDSSYDCESLSPFSPLPFRGWVPDERASLYGGVGRGQVDANSDNSEE